MSGGFKRFDLFQNISEFKKKTLGGGAVSLFCFFIVGVLVIAEIYSYSSTSMKSQLVVNTDVGDNNLKINFEIVMHSLPCNFLSIDSLDVSGNSNLEVENIKKLRIRNGSFLSQEESKKLDEEIEKVAEAKAVPQNANNCDSCYGAESESFPCCKTCDEVRNAYRAKGWSLHAVDSIAQCANEGFSAKMKSQKEEGCLVSGSVEVDRVAGNMHISPGRSISTPHSHVHDTHAVNWNNNNYNLTHTIRSFSFGQRYEMLSTPLDNAQSPNNEINGIFNYYLKVVPTVVKYSDGSVVETNQYSVTENYHKATDTTNGVYFNYDFSPIKVIYEEESKTFASFLTNLFAIIGGVYTIFNLIDTFVYHGVRSIKKKMDMGKAS